MMDINSEFVESIKACRTCGIHYVTPSKNQLKHLFQSAVEHSEIMLIRLELAQWNVEVTENDGYPQYVCNSCIHKFEQLFELRATCINSQNEFRKFYNLPNGNLANIKVKTELPDADEKEQICDFIYVDDLSDTEYDGATPFNLPHVPIKEEVLEAAAIPIEELQQTANIVESASDKARHMDVPSSLIPPAKILQKENLIAGSPIQMTTEQVVCKLCQHLSSSQDDHKQHLQRAHEIRDMECHICGKEFKNSTTARMKFHMKWHTLNKHVRCALCGFVCSSKDALREHKRANHGKIDCKICGKSVLAKKMKFHLRQHELLPKIPCEYCGQGFRTENERENHIWQIHANEDSNIPNSQNEVYSEINDDILVQRKEVQHRNEQNHIHNYKFLCAHCEQRFMEQFDLETHVLEKHRPQNNLEVEDSYSIAEPLVNASVQVTQLTTEDNSDQTNITIFEDYDNDTNFRIPANNDTLINNTPVADQANASEFPQPSTSTFLCQTENIECADNDELEPSEVTAEYHTETALNNSSTEDEESDVTDSEDKVSYVSAAYVENNLNTFACAKCTETFVTIEQLRQHHELHNTPADQSLIVTPSKPKFKCNLCSKSFDLKFSLNRHVKKHKHAPF